MSNESLPRDITSLPTLAEREGKESVPVTLSIEEALAALPDGEMVHTSETPTPAKKKKARQIPFTLPEPREVVRYAIYSSYPTVRNGRWHEESVCETMERALIVINARASRRGREGVQAGGRFMVVQQTTTTVYNNATPVEVPNA